MSALNDKQFQVINTPDSTVPSGTWMAVSSNSPLVVAFSPAASQTITSNNPLAVTCAQGTSPWTISSNNPLAVTFAASAVQTVSTNSNVPVTQMTSPWVVSSNSPLVVNQLPFSVQTINASYVFPTTTPQAVSANIGIASSANTSIIGAKIGSTINIYGLTIFHSGTAGQQQLSFIDQSGNSVLFGGPLTFSPNSGMVLDLRADPWGTCNLSTSFNILSTISNQVSGRVWYTQTP